MADDADMTQARAEIEESLRRKFSTPAITVKLEATGYCLNCEEVVGEGERFCDKDCRDDFELRNLRGMK
tara:strand:- start:1130 stop:1336 length:207 start_codon:yes stop_codon:yes gene_type:complete